MPSNASAAVAVTLLDGGSFSTADLSFLHEGAQPSLFRLYDWCFHINHPDSGRHVLWDLGISSMINPDKHVQTKEQKDYTSLVLKTQWPSASPDGPRRSLQAQLKDINVDAEQVDTVIMSHAHWDHCRPIKEEFPKAMAVFGPGTDEYCSPGHFENGTPTDSTPWDGRYFDKSGFATENWEELGGQWQQFGPFPRTHDYFGDGSFMIIDAPGHMPGNLAAAARIQAPESGELTYVVLASDCCHSRDLLLGKKEFAWFDVPGGKACLHIDIPAAKETIARLREAETSFGMHIAMAHDTEWIKLAEDKILLSLIPASHRQDFVDRVRIGARP